jgi:DNA repair exonuclease SbcCD nuclease subunit
MKIVILGDLHFGIQNGAKHFNYWFEKFLNDTFFPYLVTNNIKYVVQVGDAFHHRKQTSHHALYECKRYFFDRLQELGVIYYGLIGNHDTVHKNEIKTNSPKILLREYKFNIIDEPMEIDIEGIKLCMLPWICKDNSEDTIKLISTTTSDICFGHFEISGFSMYRGIKNKEGLQVSLFDKFEYVFSGHFHYRSQSNNIYYVGTPWQLTWNDFGEVKGFHTFDLSSRKLEFVENPYKMFHKIYYGEEYDISNIKNSYVRILVKERDSEFESYITKISDMSPVDYIIEDQMDYIEQEVDINDDTPTIIKSYIDSSHMKKLNVDTMKSMMMNLYEEALAVEK